MYPQLLLQDLYGFLRRNGWIIDASLALNRWVLMTRYQHVKASSHSSAALCFVCVDSSTSARTALSSRVYHAVAWQEPLVRGGSASACKYNSLCHSHCWLLYEDEDVIGGGIMILL